MSLRNDRLIKLFLLGAALCLSIILGVFWIALGQLEQQNQAQSAQVAKGAMRSLAFRLESITKDNAFWDESIEKTMLNRDEDWFERYFGLDSMADLDIASVLVLDPDAQITQGYIGRTSDIDPKVLARELQPLVQAVLADTPEDQSAVRSTYLIYDGRLWLYAVAAFARIEMSSADFNRKPRGALSMGIAVTNARLLELGQSFDLNQLRFDAVDTKDAGGRLANTASLAVTDGDNQLLGHFSWQAPSMQQHILRLAAFILPLLLLMALVGALFFRQLARHVRALQETLSVNAQQRQMLISKNLTLEKLAIGEPVETVLQMQLNAIESSLEGCKCAFWQLEANNRHVRALACNSLPADLIAVSEKTELVHTDPFHRAFLEGRPFSIDDISVYSRWRKIFDQCGMQDIHSVHSEPVRASKGELLGGIGVYSGQIGRLSEVQRELLRSSAHLVGIALEHKRNEEQLEFLAYNDPLTGLLNRHLFRRILENRLAESRRRHHTTAVMIIDMDHFKRINDSLGQDLGDQVIRETARRINLSVREEDAAARQGGDEFTVMLTLNEQEATATLAQVAGRILESLHLPFAIGEHSISASASIGIATSVRSSVAAVELLKHADMALYRAKQLGRDQFCFFDESVQRDFNDHIALESALKRGLTDQEFFLVYQPIVELSNRRTVGVEALVRWNSASLGLVMPDRFIPVAEHSGLILPLGEWIFAEACRGLARLKRETDQALQMSINLSARQFRVRGLGVQLERIASEAGVVPAELRIEITESLLMEDTSIAKDNIVDLKARGFSLVIDDFGTGYSSLSYLQRFPVSVLKIDRSFVNVLSELQRDRALAEAIVAMARSMELAVVAEGIETEEQWRLLRDNGCELGQGYLFARPMALEDVVTFIRGWQG